MDLPTEDYQQLLNNIVDILSSDIDLGISLIISQDINYELVSNEICNRYNLHKSNKYKPTLKTKDMVSITWIAITKCDLYIICKWIKRKFYLNQHEVLKRILYLKIENYNEKLK